MGFIEMPFEEMIFNPFLKMSKEWMLITAGDENGNNTMTASWGVFGVLWRKNIAQIFIRPQRHTKSFVDNNSMVTLSFLPEEYRHSLNICGTVSGKDVDKWELSGLHPYFVDGTTGIMEADVIMIGKKQYAQWIDPDLFVEMDNDSRCYPEKDYHEMYVLEIIKLLKKE